MVIDMHVHPGFFQDICGDRDKTEMRRRRYGLYKTSPYPLEHTLAVMNHAGIDKSVLLPLDLTTITGETIISNDEVRALVSLAPDRFIGFASVDPHREDALSELVRCFETLGLSGLKLNPSSQKFYPGDAMMAPIYELCIKYDKPILFHSGLSWEPNAPAKYARPLEFEDVALEYPGLRICLAHFGWPWIEETIMLLIKYPNVFTDTSLLYLDSPKDFYEQLFKKNMGPLWIDRNFADKVLFGSNTPRFRPVRLREGLEKIGLKPRTLEKILGLNAMNFLKLEA
jgi:predicted TIM-barrel fold metal-dependent hydrolase